MRPPDEAPQIWLNPTELTGRAAGVKEGQSRQSPEAGSQSPEARAAQGNSDM